MKYLPVGHIQLYRILKASKMSLKLPKIRIPKIKNPITGNTITAGKVFDDALTRVTGINLGIGNSLQNSLTPNRPMLPPITPITTAEPARTVFGSATTNMGTNINATGIAVIVGVLGVLYFGFKKFAKPKKKWGK